ARVVMQVHYSIAQAGGDPAALNPDSTQVGLYLSPAPLQEVSFLPVVNPLFTIPAGNSHYQVRALSLIQSDSELVSIAPHMHLLGKEMTVTARFPNGQSQELIRIDDWDFHWQGIYNYKQPIRLPAGTMIDLVEYYDNSSSNP